jgi:hypothetical protein
MPLRLIVIALFLTISCRTTSKGWQTLDFGSFQLKTPPGWSKIRQQGIDSDAGGLTNGKDTLWFDYGWYDMNLGDEDTSVYRYAKDTVNGLTATIMIPDTPGKGYISMYIPKVGGGNKFTIWGDNIRNTDIVLNIYKSIQFKNSDPSKNPPLTFSKFISKARGSRETLFYNNCASCHAINKYLVAPPLSEVIPKRSNEWVFKFLTDRKSVAGDTTHQALSAQYDLDCRVFPHLSKDELDLIIDYVKSE